MYCEPGCQLHETLHDSASFDTENARLAEVIAKEAAELLKKEPCDFVKTGRCRVVDYLAQTNLAARIILDHESISAEGLIRE